METEKDERKNINLNLNEPKNTNLTEKNFNNFFSNNTDIFNEINLSSGSMFNDIFIDGNKFFTFHNSHKQKIFLKTNFKDNKSKEILAKLDDFLESEHKKIKNINPDLEFNIEYICELTENLSEDFPEKEKSKHYFIIITRTVLYEFEFSKSNLILKNTIFLLFIEFISLSSDYRGFILHLNNSLQTSGNYSLFEVDDAFNIAFLISNLVSTQHNVVKPLIVIPTKINVFEKFKVFQNYSKFQEFYNDFSKEIFKKIGLFYPYEEDEKFIKFVPLNRVLSKFTEVICDRVIIITTKKIIEISNLEDLKESKIEIISLNKLKKIQYYINKIQLIMEDGTIYKYLTIYSGQIMQCVKHFHSKNFYNELKIVRTKF